jgi:hypothetical protein
MTAAMAGERRGKDDRKQNTLAPLDKSIGRTGFKKLNEIDVRTNIN